MIPTHDHTLSGWGRVDWVALADLLLTDALSQIPPVCLSIPSSKGWPDPSAIHKKGVYALNENTFIPKTVDYVSIDRYTSRAERITFTNPDYHNMGHFKMYLYFEGWDRHVINKEIGFGYNLDLSFAV